jgi:hypothetical protein
MDNYKKEDILVRGCKVYEIIAIVSEDSEMPWYRLRNLESDYSMILDKESLKRQFIKTGKLGKTIYG